MSVAAVSWKVQLAFMLSLQLADGMEIHRDGDDAARETVKFGLVKKYDTRQSSVFLFPTRYCGDLVERKYQTTVKQFNICSIIKLVYDSEIIREVAIFSRGKTTGF